MASITLSGFLQCGYLAMDQDMLVMFIVLNNNEKDEILYFTILILYCF